MADPRCQVELRVLDGPNRHFARPTIQLRLDMRRLFGVSSGRLDGWFDDVNADPVDPGEPKSIQRRDAVAQWLHVITRHLADLGGVQGLRVTVTRGFDDDEMIVAFPWSRERRAGLLARWVAFTVDDVGRAPLAGTFADAADRFRRASRGPRPSVPDPTVPTVAITGTNGKTTTTRLIAHLGMTAGLRAAWNSTDGIYAASADLHAGDLVEAGDWAGFGGAGRVLSTPGVELAVIEAARGGMLRRGMGVASVDVGVVTNVTEDHMGEMGVVTLADLAAVKSTVIRAVRETGWGVLNADDDLVADMAPDCRGGIIAFSPDPESMRLAKLVANGARAVTVVDGVIVCWPTDGSPAVPVVPVADVVMTMAGLSAHNLENALAGTAAAWGLGLPITQIAEGLRTFQGDPQRNPGRLNTYVRPGDGLTVVVDIAHNPDSLEALCEVTRGLVGDNGRLLLGTGTLGDRSAAIISEMGAIAGRLADVAVIAEKARYLRGREGQEVVDLFNAGVLRSGRGPLACFPSELEALDALIGQAQPADVIAFCVHVTLPEIADEMTVRDFRPATAAEIAARAMR